MNAENLKSIFDEVLKGTISPFFKALGFKKKAQNFQKQGDELVHCFNVQRSQWNSYHNNISFTFNYGFFNQEIHTIGWGKETQIQFPKTTDCFIQDRLGTISHGKDHWYDINKKTRTEKLASEIESDLKKHYSRIVEEYKSLEDLKKLVDKFEKKSSFLLSPYSHSVFLMKTGQLKKGEKKIRKYYKQAITPRVTSGIIKYPDGTSKVKKSKPYINQYYVEGMERLAKLYEIKL